MKFTAARAAVLVAAVAATMFGAIPAASAAPVDESAKATTVSKQMSVQPITVDDLKAMLKGTNADSVRVVPGKAAPTPAKILGWDPPNARQFTLTGSCDPWAGDIRSGAAAWNGLTEGGGTPVSCQTTYITDCGATGAIIGCNYNAGERITLDPAGTGQVALLAAHEFGHDWYGHSAAGCASWDSPEAVMRPTICG